MPDGKTASIQEAVALDQKVSQSPSGADVALGPEGAGALVVTAGAGLAIGVDFAGKALAAGFGAALAEAFTVDFTAGFAVVLAGFTAAGRGAAIGFEAAGDALTDVIGADAGLELVASSPLGLGSLTLK